jgi:membrane-associated phospholipid phosphatase
MLTSTIAFAKIRQLYAAYQRLAFSHRRLSLLLGFGMLGGLVVALLLDNVSLTPDVMLLVLFIAAIMLGQALVFLRDWLPFVGLLLVYESLHGLADNLGLMAHTTDIIAVERWLFGGIIPTLWLQHYGWRGNPQWYDIAATVLYFMHFVLPLVCAFWLWTRSKRHYWQFVVSLVALCFASFLTYMAFPATPPWLAARQGDLPTVVKVIDKVLNLFPTQMTVSTLYHNLNPNPVAAMPSLHAAFPWLVFLMLWQVLRRKALWFLPYCLCLWLSIVYLGEHYVIDAIAGILYATVIFMFVQWVFVRRGWIVLSPLASNSAIMTELESPQPLGQSLSAVADR